MAGSWETGKRVDAWPTRRPALAVLLVGLASCFVTLAGCQAPNESRAQPGGDVLFGEKPFEKPSIGPTPPPQNRANLQAPQPPTATASKSITSMIANPDPLLGGKSIAITDPNARPAGNPQGSWMAKDKQPTPGVTVGGNGSPSVTIRSPELPPVQPVPPPTVQIQPIDYAPVPNSAQPPPPMPQTGSVPFADYNQLMAALKARGVLWTNQQGVAGGVRFSAGLPNPQDNSYERVVEATAPDYRSAIIAVLRKIDER